MSLAPGQSTGFVNQIENRKSFPKMSTLFFIWQYLCVHPKEFFDDTAAFPGPVGEIAEQAGKLSQEKPDHLPAVIKDMQDSDV